MIKCKNWNSRSSSPGLTASSRKSACHPKGFRSAHTLFRSDGFYSCFFIARAASDSTSIDGKAVSEATRTTAGSGEGTPLGARSRARHRLTQATEPPQTASVPDSRTDAGIPPLAVAVAAVAGLGVLAVLYKTFFVNVGSQAKSAVEALPQTVAQGLQQKRLQRDAQARLNEMCEQLRALPSVDLSAKNLGDEGTAYVVEALAFNTSCRALDLSKNGISGGLGAAALAQVLPGAALSTLVLNTNSLGDGGAEQLAKVIAGHPHLATLDLGQNGIGDAGAAALAEAIKLNTRLQRLDLSGNAIDKDGAAALAAALAASTTLEVLVLTDNYLGEAGALSLGDALRANNSLKELHLKGNEIGDAGVAAICEALMARHGDITVLDLGNNSLTEAGAAVLTRMLSLKRSLKELNLYMNDIGDSGMAKMAHAIADNKGLAVLDVGGNNIGPKGVAALVGALRNHGSLTSLELGYNPLGPEGTKTVTDLAKFNLPKLSTLKMGWCKVAGGDGARALSDLLLLNNTLSHVDLRGNALGNDGAILLSRGLKAAENSKIVDLDLGYNEIKDDGACALAQALKANPEGAPKELKLNSNYITRFGQVALSEAVDMVYEMGKGKMTTVHF
ncbi:hypothetical protein VaNZ11_012165 [Volvox africanus]|uniref:Uncharacterized protein n=1 Tax=Volvox africanus TaxID=51714 RepID=A0ABQ5SEH9_9CHLO|nr:hypothetical protein VaNZ11_012165 [Volvox africanus]